MKDFVDKYVLGKPQPVRLYPKKSRLERMNNFMKEWESVIIGFLLAAILIVSFVPFL